MDKCFTGDLYRSVPAPKATADPSYDPEARIYQTRRIPSPDANTYDPSRELVTSYGLTKKAGSETAWIRVDHENSRYDPNTTTTTVVSLNDDSPEITIFTHVWARTWNDPLASETYRVESSKDRAKKLRNEITMICSKRRPEY